MIRALLRGRRGRWRWRPWTLPVSGPPFPLAAHVIVGKLYVRSRLWYLRSIFLICLPNNNIEIRIGNIFQTIEKFEIRYLNALAVSQKLLILCRWFSASSLFSIIFTAEVLTYWRGANRDFHTHPSIPIHLLTAFEHLSLYIQKHLGVVTINSKLKH